MAEFEHYFQSLRELHALTQAMLQLAREERWDDLLEQAALQQQLLSEQEQYSVSADTLTSAQAAEVRALLAETEAANSEVIARSRAWQTEVAKIIQDVGTARVTTSKLDRAYRS